MPNWCVGTLKIRGKKKDIKRFLLEGLQPVDFVGMNKPKLKADTDEEGVFELYTEETCHIPHTARGFIKELEVSFEEKDDETITITADAKFAWNICAEQLLKCCNQYDLDMKIYAFELGMEFNQNVEIVNGEIVKDEAIEFDDYTWECPCPNLGG